MDIERQHEQLAAEFCAAIKKMAENEDALSNFEGYLSYHFAKWFERFITSPEGLVTEMQLFASMYNS